MTIIGIGTDIIECERIGHMVEKHGEHFMNRVFTEDEVRYCTGRRNNDQHFAGRWAAKEAVLKALGTGWIAGITWQDVEIANEPSGRPIIRLHGGAAEIAKEREIREVQISITHCQAYAVAFAVAVG